MYNLNKIYSTRLYFKYDNDIYNVIYKSNDKIIGFIKEINNDNYLIIEFNIIDEYQNIGLQTEALREYLRYKYLWEKKIDIIRVYPKNEKTINVLNKRWFIKENNYYIINKEIYLSHIEKLSLFDSNLNLLDYPNLRGEEIKNNTYAGIVDILIYNENNNKYLVTLRDINKVTSPGKWEFTCGGIDYKEKISDALKREAFEETGLNVINYIYLGHTFIKDLVYFSHIGIVNTNPDSVILQKGETTDYKWLTKEELFQLYGTDLVPNTQKMRFNLFKEYILKWK